MLLKDHLSASGARLFHWRSYVLLAFAPFFLYAAYQGEVIERFLGPTLGDGWEFLAIAIVALGEAIRILTVGFVPPGTSGRNVNGQVAEVLNTTGAYSLVRNPLYLGNCLMYVGLALFSQNIALAVILALVLLPYYERIIAAEEAFLLQKFGAPYADWAARTPAFLPRLTGFVRPALPFSARWALRREMASAYGAIFALYFLELGLHHLGTEPEPMSPVWHWVMAVATVAFLVARHIKRHTNLLPEARD